MLARSSIQTTHGPSRMGPQALAAAAANDTTPLLGRPGWKIGSDAHHTATSSGLAPKLASSPGTAAAYAASQDYAALLSANDVKFEAMLGDDEGEYSR